MGCIEEQIDFPDLQSLLRKCFGDQIKLINFKSTKFLPFGENYCSTMVKVEALVRDKKKSQEELLHLVAKTGNEFEKYPLIWSTVFKKEVFMYRELIPMFNELELEMGINEDDLFSNVVKFYGYRNSLKVDVEEVDRDSLILMENLKVRGYYTADRRIGMDYEHAKKALNCLARYHALGIAIKQKKPKFFETVKSHARVTGIHIDQMIRILDGMLQILQDHPRFSKHLNIMKKSFDYCKNIENYNSEPDDPWATITHGDFWCNNMMFHKNAETGEIDDIKFCDFQLYLYQSPLRDLPYFLCSSIDQKTETDYYDDLIDCYYESFIETINFMQCEGDFSRESFDSELKKQALSLFAIYASIVKICISDLTDCNEDQKNLTAVFERQESTCFMNRLLKIVEIYERKKWF